MLSIFASIRFRILAFFLFSILGFVTAIVFSLLQLQQIGEGLDRINECYLPLSKDVAYTQASLRLLEQEHERIRLASTITASRASFYIVRLDENLTSIAERLETDKRRLALQVETPVLDRLAKTQAQAHEARRV